MFASLPMYDWPEIRVSTDRYWQLLRERLIDHGIADLPHNLQRDSDPHGDWAMPDMALSQTCGLPYVRDLQGCVLLLGTPSYDIEAGSGSYYSVLIGRQDGPGGLEYLSEYCAAYNDIRSQSGYAALLQTVIDGQLTLPSVWQCSGSHRSSIAMVAEERADIAAIDAVSWALAKRHDPAAKRVKVIGHTAQTPGLPYITATAYHAQAPQMRQAISEAMAALGEGDRDALLLTGFVERREDEYAPIGEGWARIVERCWQNLPAKRQ